MSRKVRQNWAALKIDTWKAYDRKNKNYIHTFMLKLGFSSRCCDIIMNCVSMPFSVVKWQDARQIYSPLMGCTKVILCPPIFSF